MSGRILVVDDDELICDLVSETLSFEGYQVNAAYSGEQALAMLEHTRVDLVLLDVMLSGIDGFEVCRAMLADERTRDIPVLFLTARGQFEDELRGYEEGAFDFITKPFHPLNLAPAIREVLDTTNQRTLDERRLRRIEQLRNLVHLRDRGRLVTGPTKG